MRSPLSTRTESTMLMLGSVSGCLAMAVTTMCIPSVMAGAPGSFNDYMKMNNPAEYHRVYVRRPCRLHACMHTIYDHVSHGVCRHACGCNQFFRLGVHQMKCRTTRAQHAMHAFLDLQLACCVTCCLKRHGPLLDARHHCRSMPDTSLSDTCNHLSKPCLFVHSLITSQRHTVVALITCS